MVAAMTIMRIKPKSQQEALDAMIPTGTALLAFLASSDMCTQLSKAPMVLCGMLREGVSTIEREIHLPYRAKPRKHESPPRRLQKVSIHISHSQELLTQEVRFSVCVKTYLAECRRFLAPMGSAMMVAAMRTKFMKTNTVWSLPMILDMTDERTAWQRTAAKKTP